MTYRDFTISYNGWGWQGVHTDYDGPEDNRAFTGMSEQEVRDQIDEWHDEQVPDVSLALRYCRDPEFRAAMDAERDREQEKLNAHFAAITRQQNEARWAAEEALASGMDECIPARSL